jgi:hypothetical protein
MTGFWCIEGFRVNHRILVLMGSPNEQSYNARPDISASQISARNHRVMCAVYLTYRLSYRDLVEMMASAASSFPTRLFFVGYSAMSPNSRGGGLAMPAACIRPGGWTRLRSRCVAGLATCTVPSTSTAKPSVLFSVQIAASFRPESSLLRP